MEKHKRKILSTLLIIFISISGYIIYDVLLFDYFNELRLEKRKVKLVENYHKNEDSFKKFNSMIEGIGNINNLAFNEPNKVRFSVFGKIYDSIDIAPIIIDINKDSLDIDYEFKDDAVTLTFSDTILEFDNWKFYIDTDLNDKRITRLLDYINITPRKLNTIKNELKNLNCKALTKNSKLIKFRYAGHFGESLDYIIPLKHEEIENEIIKIKDVFYYGITSDFIFCGVTKW